MTATRSRQKLSRSNAIGWRHSVRTEGVGQELRSGSAIDFLGGARRGRISKSRATPKGSSPKAMRFAHPWVRYPSAQNGRQEINEGLSPSGDALARQHRHEAAYRCDRAAYSASPAAR